MRQFKTLDEALVAFYRLEERNDGIPPSMREFQAQLGLSSTSSAGYWFLKLELAGLIYTPLMLTRDHGEYQRDRTRKLTAEGYRRARALLQAASA